jgi:hypothetical protein
MDTFYCDFKNGLLSIMDVYILHAPEPKTQEMVSEMLPICVVF